MLGLALLLFRGKATLIQTHWRGLRRWVGLRLLLGGVALRAVAARLKPARPRVLATDRWAVLWSQRTTWTAGYPRQTPPT